MQIIPAIDIKGGRCVRLTRGDENTETVFSNDPVKVAKRWQELGARWIHIVDLDGAFEGIPRNFDLISNVISSVDCDIQVGGGIRDVDTVEMYIKAGVRRVIIGTAAFTKKGFIESICFKYPGKIAVGVDTKKDRIAIKGWKDTLDLEYKEVLEQLGSVGVSLLIHTDIDKDGTLQGVNIDSVSKFLESSPIPVIASGGVSSLEDIEKLSALEDKGLYGVILGKSIYKGNIDLKTAIEKFGDT